MYNLQQMRQSYATPTIDVRKSVNLEAERTKLAKERVEIIEKFERTHLFDDNNKIRRGVIEKTYVDGSRYIGESQGDNRHGRGIYHYGNGDSYVGEWRDDKFHGKGSYIFTNGE